MRERRIFCARLYGSCRISLRMSGWYRTTNCYCCQIAESSAELVGAGPIDYDHATLYHNPMAYLTRSSLHHLNLQWPCQRSDEVEKSMLILVVAYSRFAASICYGQLKSWVWTSILYCPCSCLLFMLSTTFQRTLQTRSQQYSSSKYSKLSRALILSRKEGIFARQLLTHSENVLMHYGKIHPSKWPWQAFLSLWDGV